MSRADSGRDRAAAPDEQRNQASPWAWLRTLGPAAVSTLIHLLVLLALAMLFVARDRKPDPFVIVSEAPAEQAVEDAMPVEFDADVAPPEETEPVEAMAAEMPALDVAAAVPDPVPDPAALDDLAAADAAPAVDLAGSLPAAEDVMAAFGGNGAAEAATGRVGGGKPAGRAAGAPTFFGKTGKGQSVCFICDNSNSYRDGGFHMVLAELARAVDALKPEQSFFVIFCSDAAYPLFHPDRVDGLQPATIQNKQRLQAWLATVEMCTGGQGIRDAVKMATDLGADVVYFLSDGEHAESVVRRVVTADFGDTVVHTFGMQQNVFDRKTGMLDPKRVAEQQLRNQTLIDIAKAHGGEFTPVQVPPEAAAMEKMRPIPKNDRRGPIWGTRIQAPDGN
ncbi:MAG: hypothetical protein ACKON7_08530 [Planctomycetaceae bacterium]